MHILYHVIHVAYNKRTVDAMIICFAHLHLTSKVRIKVCACVGVCGGGGGCCFCFDKLKKGWVIDDRTLVSLNLFIVGKEIHRTLKYDMENKVTVNCSQYSADSQSLKPIDKSLN